MKNSETTLLMSNN